MPVPAGRLLHLPPSTRLGSPACLDSVRACHGALYSSLHSRGCQRPAPSPPSPRGGRREREGEGGQRAGLYKSGWTRAASQTPPPGPPALPAAPRDRADPPVPAPQQ